MSDRTRFSKALFTLAEALGAELTENKVKVYCDLLLARYPIEALEAATMQAIETPGRKFFPTVPEFHGIILGDPNTRAGKALAVLRRTMAGVGSYRSVRFEDDALTCAVEQMGGWVEMCASDRSLGDDFKGASFWDRRFKEAYIEAYMEGRKPQRRYFKGIAEHHNENATITRGALPAPEVSVVALDGSTKCRTVAQLMAPEQPLLAP